MMNDGEYVLYDWGGDGMIVNNIDDGKAFDWGKTSLDYAKYRDIYPEEFYQYILIWDYVRMDKKFLI